MAILKRGKKFFSTKFNSSGEDYIKVSNDNEEFSKNLFSIYDEFNKQEINFFKIISIASFLTT